MRFFAAPKKGGGKGGAPAEVVEYKGEPRFVSAFEKLIEDKGVDAFPLGPPKGTEKTLNVHRDYIAPKSG